MTTMEELQKACENLVEANEASAHMYDSEEETRKICTGRKHKFVKRVSDSKMSTYNYKPAMRRNLPYQRRNF